MDVFEKAHVLKKSSSRRDSKSEEAVKKQLKQMLYGYKHSDSKLIKSCEDKFDPNKFNEDSSSVSGFSDLNITNSSNEADTSHKTDDPDEEDILEADEETFDETDNVNIYEESTKSSESLSEHSDKMRKFYGKGSQESTLDLYSDDSINLSIVNSLAETVSDLDTTDSDFDADGVLAMKIMEKLGKKVSNKLKATKRKLLSDKYNQSEESKVNVEEIITTSRRRKESREEDISDDFINEESSHDDRSVSNCSASESNSPAFISVVATEMPTQSLSEVIGEYKHPTIKNLPTDIQNISAHNSRMFSIEDVNLEDIQIEEEVSSLTPEYDNNDTIDDINTTDMDTSMEPSASTSAYDNTLQYEETSEKEDSLDISDNFISSVNVYYGRNNCVCVLKHPAEIFIHGKVKVKALGGTLELFGHRLDDKPCEVYAPNYNYAHCIKTVVNDNLYNGLFSKLTSEGLNVVEAEEIVTGLAQYDGVISFRKLNNHKMDFVENNMTTTDLFSKPKKSVDNCFRKASEILKCSLYLNRPWKTFEEVSSFRNAVECGLKDQSRGIVCGGKGVGKSTFLRYSVNRLLSHGPVLVIDLDPGQAEFTVAGNVSATIVDKPLIGPNFTHLKTPEMMFNIGMINTMDNPRRYAAAVGALINYCHHNEQLKSMTWIINTMGMCNAMGLKFMTLTILNVQPTYLLQIDSKNPKKGFEVYLDCYAVKKLYEENYYNDPLFADVKCPRDFDYSFFTANRSDRPVKNNFSLPPRDERYLNFLAYFGDLMSSNRSNVLGVVPYEVKLEDLHIGLNVKVTEDAVTKVINGKIVALCQLNTEDDYGKVFTLKNKALLCHGHGLIRGVDMERRMVYIITPMAMDKLSQVNTLVYADWVPELRGQETQLPEGISIPYRTATMYQKRQLMFAPRRRFNPLQLLKMSRNS